MPTPSTHRTLIVGDVHGCFDELLELLWRCDYTMGRDRLILLGDLINKGPKSLEVLRFARDNSVEVILGNHELAFLQFIKAESQYATPQLKTLRDQMGDRLPEWVDWIQNWPTFLEEEDFLVVHAGLVPNRPPEATPLEILTNLRTWDNQNQRMGLPHHTPWYHLYDEDKLVVYGHWAVQGLNVRVNTIGLDDGCVYGRTLCALILPERRIVRVKAKQIYQIPGQFRGHK